MPRHGRQPVVAARAGPGRPPAGRGGPRVARRGRRRPAQRGPLHRRRHRVGQPRRQGPLLEPAGRRPAPDPRSSPAPSSTTPSWTRRSGWPSTRVPRSSGCRSTPPAGSTRRPRRGARAATRARSRWSASCGPTTRSARCSRSPSSPRSPRAHEVPIHSDAVQAFGAAAGRLRRDRARRHDRDRAQDRRPARGRRCSCCAGPSTSRRSCTAAARSATSAPGRWTPRPSSGSPRPPRSRSSCQPERAETAARLRDDLVRRLRAAVPDAVLGGDPDLVAGHRLPGNAHFSFPGCEGDALLLLLDAAGIECSTGSACSAGVPQPSHVLLAMGVPESLARGSLRFSFGHTSTAADVDARARRDRPGRRARPEGRPGRRPMRLVP